MLTTPPTRVLVELAAWLTLASALVLGRGNNGLIVWLPFLVAGVVGGRIGWVLGQTGSPAWLAVLSGLFFGASAGAVVYVASLVIMLNSPILTRYLHNSPGSDGLSFLVLAAPLAAVPGAMCGAIAAFCGAYEQIRGDSISA